MIYAPSAERGVSELSSATPCIATFYTFQTFLCSQIVATREYLESTHRYCCQNCTLANLRFKGTKKKNILQMFDVKYLRNFLATIFSARCKPLYIKGLAPCTDSLVFY